METSLLNFLLTNIAPRLPILLVCIGGLAFALARLQTNRKPAILVCVGALSLLVALLVSFFIGWYAMSAGHAGRDVRQIGNVVGALGLMQTILVAAGYVLLISAAFIDRTPPQTQTV